MSENPDTFTLVLSILELASKEFEIATVVWVGSVTAKKSESVSQKDKHLNIHEVEEIALVPKVSVKRDDSKFRILWMINTVCGVMHACL